METGKHKPLYINKKKINLFIGLILKFVNKKIYFEAIKINKNKIKKLYKQTRSNKI